MPNYCNNSLVVHGEANAIKDFYAACRNGEGFSILANLYPVPTALKDTMAGGYSLDENGNERPEQIILNAKREDNIQKYGYPDWYDWSVAKWGTKWPEDETTLAITDSNTIKGRFVTAWAPPTEGFLHISTMFPTLTFALWFEESGVGFAGLSVLANGNINYDNCIDISTGVDENDDGEGVWDMDFYYESLSNIYDNLLAESKLSNHIKQVINLRNFYNEGE
jgi:hypothetical protein